VKVFQKQRKKFDPTANRMPEEAMQALTQAKKAEVKQAKGKGKGKQKAAAAPATEEQELKKQPAWKLKSEAFRNAMKDAKVIKECQAKGKPLPPPKPTAPELDDRIGCPHCGRKFGEQQALRHIPLCAKAKARPKPPPKR
jgi:hypothetical protein